MSNTLALDERNMLPSDTNQGIKPRSELTAKQEGFCNAIVEGKTQMAAYKQCYDADAMKYNTIAVKASELMRNPKIRDRIKELRDQIAAERRITLDGHLNDLLALRNRAAQLGMISVAVAAEIARAKAAGLYVEQVDVQHTHRAVPASIDDFV